MRKATISILVFVSILPIFALSGASASDSNSSTAALYFPIFSKNINLLRINGGRVDWSATGNRIAFDREITENHYEVFTMNPDGSNVTCITCSIAALPHISNGNPAWDPSGQWIIFQAAKPGHLRPTHLTPGIGIRDDLWMIKPDRSDVREIVSLPDGPNEGLLHPHFSPDGTKLSWSQMTKIASPWGTNQEYGYWQLAVADYSGGDNPSLSDIQYFSPGGDAFYENHGISPDNQWLYFTSNMNAGQLGKPAFEDNDIYRMNLGNGSVEQLTTVGYNEHAELNSRGDTLVFMSSADEQNSGTDYWLMDADGTNKRRLTYFNEPRHAEYSPNPLVAADSSWSPDGDQIVAYVLTDVQAQHGEILLINVSSP